MIRLSKAVNIGTSNFVALDTILHLICLSFMLKDIKDVDVCM